MQLNSIGILAMNISKIEHEYAPQLEQNLLALYQQVRFRRSELDMQYWQELFIKTLPDWKPLMLFRELEFDLWISAFLYCYQCTLYDLQLMYLEIDDVEQVKQFIDLLLKKLCDLFASVNFFESIKKEKEEHDKHIRKYRMQYEEVTKYQHHLNTVRLYCTYQADYHPFASIFDLAKHIKEFERKVERNVLVKMGCLYFYRKVFRVPEKNQYVCAYFLSFNERLLNRGDGLYQQLKQQWLDATNNYGLVLDVDSDLPWEERSDDFLAMFEDMEDACDDLNGMTNSEFYNVGDKATRLRVRPKKFQQFLGKPIKSFNL